MEADISIWQKPGHFYFALTRQRAPLERDGPPALTSGRKDNWATTV